MSNGNHFSPQSPAPDCPDVWHSGKQLAVCKISVKQSVEIWSLYYTSCNPALILLPSYCLISRATLSFQFTLRNYWRAFIFYIMDFKLPHCQYKSWNTFSRLWILGNALRSIGFQWLSLTPLFPTGPMLTILFYLIYNSIIFWTILCQTKYGSSHNQRRRAATARAVPNHLRPNRLPVVVAWLCS